MMRRIRGWRSVGAGLVVGLAWGLFAALVEGLPLLLQDPTRTYLGQRLVALAYLAVLYGVLCALGGSLLGAILALLSRLTKFEIENPGAKIAALFAAATAGTLWLQRFQPGLIGWAVIVILAAGVGLVSHWLLRGVGRARPGAWTLFRVLALGLFAVALVAVLGVAGFRLWLRDARLFNPRLTDQVATAEQPNFVLITAGGVRPDHLGVFGYDPEISPNVDAVAWRGTRFEQAFAQASWSEPSLASLFTSLYPSELGIDCRPGLACTPHLDGARLTLAEALQGAGYATQAYLTDPWLSAELGFAQGFDGFEGVRDPQPFDLGALSSGTLGRLLGCGRQSAACRLLGQGHGLLFDAPIPVGWGGDRANARVGRFLDLHGDERFFVWVHYTEALPPYDLERPFRPLPKDDLASKANRLRSLGYWELGDPFTAREVLLPRDVEGLTALYDAEVHRVDRLVGGLNVLLEAHGLTDRTVVIFAATHGQEFMEHGGYTYGHSLYDEVLRVPLVIGGPGAGSPGQAVQTPVALLDLAPTILSMAGVPVPAGTEGRSLVPALRGEALAERPVYSESLYRVPYELKAVHAGGHKLIYRLDDGSYELYDLALDPLEQRDISSDGGQIGEALRGELLDWVERMRQVAADLPRAVPPIQLEEAAW